METFPRLLIIPNDESTSFDIFYQENDKIDGTKFLASVKTIKIDYFGGKPDWLIKSKRERHPKKRYVSHSAPTVKEMIVAVAESLYPRSEFTTAELTAELGEIYPHIRWTTRRVATFLRRSRLFEKRKSGKYCLWKHRNSSLISSQTEDIS